MAIAAPTETGEVTQEMLKPIPNHPLATVAGSFEDDPFWDEFIQAMKDSRRVIDNRVLVDLEDK